MKTLSLVFLGSTGAGPIYSLSMARAIAERKEYKLNIIISKTLSIKDVWYKTFDNDSNVTIYEVDTYKHNYISLVLSFLKFRTISKVVKILKESDICYVPFGLIWAPLIYPKLKNHCKLITTIHDPHPHNPKSIIEQIAAKIDYYTNGLADSIVLLNKRDFLFVKNRYPNLPITIIPHANFDYYTHLSDNFNQNTINYHIAFLGTISWYKGLDILIDAFLKLKTKNIKLTIAGKGDISNELYQKIISNSNITLYNRYIEDYEIGSILKTVDFLVLPYRNASQSGVIPLAYSFGKTVIATKVGALEEQVPEGVGILVNPTISDVAFAIDELYKNENKIIELGNRAKNYAETELSWTNSARLVANIIDSLLN